MTADSASSTVQVHGPHEGIAEVRLHRPEVKNALSMELREAVTAIFQRFACLPAEQLRCVVLTGGDEAFAAGADIQDMVDTTAVEMYLRRNERFWSSVGNCPVPVIAAVEKYALGGGLELAMHADIIIAGQSAKLGQPEVNVGIMPGAGGTQRLTRAVGKFHAMRMLLTGEAVKADEAFSMGLVSRVVADGEATAAAHGMAARIAAMPPLAVAQIKEVIAQGADLPLESALALERKALHFLFSTQDKREGMVAFREKRKPEFRGH